MDSESSDEINANDPKTILDACLTDDLQKLQVLLAETEQFPGRNDSGIRWDAGESNLPEIQELLIKAAVSKQAMIVRFLFQRYPTLSLSQHFGLIQAILDNPDADTLQALCNHDRKFASFSIDDHYQCFITEACLRPPEEIRFGNVVEKLWR